MRFITQLSILGIPAWFVVLVWPAACVADETTNDASDLRAGVATKLQPVTEKQRQRFHGCMKLKLEELEQACDLTGEQLKTLDIAAKGTVERFTDRWVESTIRWIEQRAGPFAKNQGNEAAIEQFAREEAFQQFEYYIGAGMIGAAMSREPLWRKALEKTLTAEQLAEYDAVTRRRQASISDTMVDYILATLDQELILSNKQRQTVRGMLVDQLAHGELNTLRGSIWGSYFLMSASYKIPEEDWSKVLSATQMDIWKEKATKMQQLGSMDAKSMVGPWGELLEFEAAGKQKK